jgi:hypothetical protein
VIASGEADRENEWKHSGEVGVARVSVLRPPATPVAYV